MNESTLINLCLKLKGAIKTNPFKREEYEGTTVIRHKDNRKWFAVIYRLEKKLYMNLKCKPDDTFVLREQYESITPAWHMNKKHWNKIDVSDIDVDLLNTLIRISYDLTAANPKHK